MCMKKLREFYGVPAKRGMRVKYSGGVSPRVGTIKSCDAGQRLRVLLDGERFTWTMHPTFKIEYLEEDKK